MGPNTTSPSTSRPGAGAAGLRSDTEKRMSTPSVITSSRLVGRTVVAPSLGLAEVVTRRSILPALLGASLATLVYAGVLQSRIDVTSTIDAAPATPDTPALTPHEVEEALATAHKMAVVKAYAGAIAGPTLTALGLAVALWLGFAVSSRRPGFVPTLAVASYAQLPAALGKLLTIPALLSRPGVSPAELDSLLPSHLAALTGLTSPPALVGALGAVDLFSLWALVLAVLGMRIVSGTSVARATATVAALWLAYVGVVDVALPSLLAGGPK